MSTNPQVTVVPPYDESKKQTIRIAPNMVLKIDPEYEEMRQKLSTRLIQPYGRYFRNLPVMQGLCPQMPPGECYDNAMQVAIAFGLIYCEGLMVFDHPGYKTHRMPHAWCVDTDGRVLDPTCLHVQHQSHIKYLGIPFKTEYAMDWYEKTGFHGMLDGHPELGDSVGVYKDDPSLWLHPHTFKE